MRAAVPVALAGVAGCSSILTVPDEPDLTDTPTPTAVDEAPTVLMDASSASNYGGTYWFDPIGLFVPPETNVTWLSQRGSPHTATAYPERIPETAEPFDSASMVSGQTYEYTFTVPGTYDYVCLPHRHDGMVGRVVCGEPGGPATGTETPDGPVPDAERIVAAGRLSPSDLAD